jgi:hypothetical protein
MSEHWGSRERKWCSGVGPGEPGEPGSHQGARDCIEARCARPQGGSLRSPQDPGHCPSIQNFSTDFDDSGRYPREIVTLHAPLYQLFGLRGRGKERSLSARAGCPLGPSLASQRHGSVVQWGGVAMTLPVIIS